MTPPVSSLQNLECGKFYKIVGVLYKKKKKNSHTLIARQKMIKGNLTSMQSTS